MKRYNSITIASMVAVSTVVLFGFSAHVMAATGVTLGTAGSFAVLAGTNVNNVPTSTITGNVGLSPAAGSNYSGITQSQVTGTIYAVDNSGPGGSVSNPALLTAAKNDLTAAYLDAAGRTPTTTFVSSDNQLGGQTLTPGVYAFGHATSANLTAASPLILDAQGDPDAVFIMQASSDLVTASGSVVQLVNGAQACNVYWQVGSSATLGSGSTFKGTIMALTANNLVSGATVEGRILARNAAVTLDTNTITVPACTTGSGNSGGTTGGGTGGSSGSGSSSNGAGTVTPKLPDTGTAPRHTDTDNTLWLAAGTSGLTMAGSFAYLIRKQRAL